MKKYFCLLVVFTTAHASDIILADFRSKIDPVQAPQLIRTLVETTLATFPDRFDDVFRTLPGDLTSNEYKCRFVAGMFDSALVKWAKNTNQAAHRAAAGDVATVADLARLLDCPDSEFDTLFSDARVQAFASIARMRDLGEYKRLYARVAQRLMLIHHQAIPLAARLRQLSQSNLGDRFTLSLSAQADTMIKEIGDRDQVARLNAKIAVLKQSLTFYEDRNPRPKVADGPPPPYPAEPPLPGVEFMEGICNQQ